MTKTLAISAAALLLATGAAFADTNKSSSTAVSGSISQASAEGGAAYNTNIISTGRGRYRSAPSVVAPGLAASAVETCMGSSSAGGSGMGWGFSIGSTYNDGGCEARLDSRTLFAMGQRRAAIYRLCERPKMAAALLMAGTPCPQDQPKVVSVTDRRGRTRVVAQRQPVGQKSLWQAFFGG